MHAFYFTFRSMTAAQQAAIMLLQYGVDAEFVRAPHHLSEMGCTYAIRLRQEDAYRGGLLLHQQGLRYERGILDPGWTGMRK